MSRLVHQFGDMARELGDWGHAIRMLAGRGLVAMRAVASRDRALSATLDQLPSTLAGLRSASNVVSTATDQTAPVFSNLALGQLRAAIQALRPPSGGGQDLLCS